ncbi:hypothetical protein Patl1_05272 [Pistacia atlantica]|uniref:Uncharacterized protein n=1 Tax=Pistacia atlantica TaxID=434234 RepID=A0ACC1BV71_9ROSI|nr:hypothetical protein Patl1_05272 [Pistacia atlantica]
MDKSGKLVRPPPQYNFIRKSPWEEFVAKRSLKNFQSDLETRAKTSSLETDGKNDILSQALGTKEHLGKQSLAIERQCSIGQIGHSDSQANIVAKGTIIEYEGPNVWVTMDVVFDGSPSLPFLDDEEFLVKVSDAIGHHLLWPEELVLRVANMVKTTIMY